ncbi:hypothetical protein TTRE_0000582801 [Trichuris trichiura]|uniref:Uncharacterized protein n=1 Tax=Trichuris trichiura TaxID=36087 RepID=A0A077ZB35_TRITR|nr:hypothetical protein TTRE_0000582801 [Trichuris trichiura]
MATGFYQSLHRCWLASITNIILRTVRAKRNRRIKLLKGIKAQSLMLLQVVSPGKCVAASIADESTIWIVVVKDVRTKRLLAVETASAYWTRRRREIPGRCLALVVIADLVQHMGSYEVIMQALRRVEATSAGTAGKVIHRLTNDARLLNAVRRQLAEQVHFRHAFCCFCSEGIRRRVTQWRVENAIQIPTSRLLAIDVTVKQRSFGFACQWWLREVAFQKVT